MTDPVLKNSRCVGRWGTGLRLTSGIPQRIHVHFAPWVGVGKNHQSSVYTSSLSFTKWRHCKQMTSCYLSKFRSKGGREAQLLEKNKHREAAVPHKQSSATPHVMVQPSTSITLWNILQSKPSLLNSYHMGIGDSWIGTIPQAFQGSSSPIMVNLAISKDFNL